MPLLATIGTAAEQAYGYVTYAKDRFFSLVTTLISGSGTNASNNNTILDSSSNNFTVTRFGNVAQGTFTPFSRSVGFWSNYFDGSGDYLTIPDNAALKPGTSNFCVEMLFYPFSVAGTPVLTTKRQLSTTVGSPFQIYISAGTVYVAFQTTSGFNVGVVAIGTVTTGQWNHVAAYRIGNAWYGALNGIITVVNSNLSGSLSDYLTAIVIGGDTNANYFNGFISNYRMVVGSSVYTSSSAPIPTTPLTAITNTQLLTCQSNRFADNSNNNFTVTKNGDTRITTNSPFYPIYSPNLYNSAVSGGSLNFDGTGDYLSVAGSSNLAFGTGDFTIECFINMQSLVGFIYDSRTAGSQLTPCIYITGSTIVYYVGGAARITSATVATNQWYHLVVSRVSSNTRMFLNGVQTGSTYADTTNYINNTNRPFIGANGDATSSFYFGYISNIRVLVGTGTTAPTVPTAPLTAITNTQLLLSGTNANIYDASASANVETVGSTQISNAVIKYGTGSVSFNGTTDYLNITCPLGTGTTNNSAIAPIGDFTIESWINPTNFGATKTVFHINGNTSGYAAVRVDIAITTGLPTLYLSTTGAAWAITLASATALTAGAWSHIAIVRSGTNITFYLNGVSVGTSSALVSSSSLIAGTLSLVGATYSTSAIQFFVGYMSNLRITQAARYTTTFTPPTGMFPVQG
jgi:hypothetical protein